MHIFSPAPIARRRDSAAPRNLRRRRRLQPRRERRIFSPIRPAPFPANRAARALERRARGPRTPFPVSVPKRGSFPWRQPILSTLNFSYIPPTLHPEPPRAPRTALPRCAAAAELKRTGPRKPRRLRAFAAGMQCPPLIRRTAAPSFSHILPRLQRPGAALEAFAARVGSPRELLRRRRRVERIRPPRVAVSRPLTAAPRRLTGGAGLVRRGRGRGRKIRRRGTGTSGAWRRRPPSASGLPSRPPRSAAAAAETPRARRAGPRGSAPAPPRPPSRRSRRAPRMRRRTWPRSARGTSPGFLPIVLSDPPPRRPSPRRRRGRASCPKPAGPTRAPDMA
mmetsp:Transcript_14867/g.52969  ORF Transcript_14867/g.52969 Transcript_14867/m.52969 type:complete len:336 (-) Transcript_14867:81-1088(-)